jgi:hypothetical protein
MAEFRASNLLIAVIAGVAGAALTPALRQSQNGSARALLKRAVKGGLLLYEKGIETFTELTEHASDLLVEARCELEEERAGQDGAPPHPAETDQVVPLRAHDEGEAKAHG